MIISTSVLSITLFIYCSALPLADEKSIKPIGDERTGDVTFDEEIMSKIIQNVTKKSLGTPDFKVGYKLDAWTTKSRRNPEELGSYYQGDILLKDGDRNGIIGDQFRWPNGIVYYTINGDFSPQELITLRRAMLEIERYTCVRFFRLPGEERDQRDYVSFESGHSGCWSSVGRAGGAQSVNLQPPSCFVRVGTVIHELLHVLGFNHEHSRVDRDDYIRILYDNIEPEEIVQFSQEPMNAFGIEYDYNSVLHYSQYSFSRNGEKTILARRPGGDNMGQRVQISWPDVYKVRAMYKCDGSRSRLV